ncbi:arylesterase [Phaeobacter sp. 22II1-1F12B]|uniref:arylesterase n=1 Tax=Phaeobacter sp. 22II1-1F12B TaxID=1317111 RepID=UPI000B522F3B|nr:arylesterase [Phaeobacter sp. 22II1-1F12B]OWU81805.1 GDSL family lipase [Phaeobacter sp. 22II1-1F12B]
MRKILLSIVFICNAVFARAEQVTIAALGDSLTQGYGLAQGEGLVPQLEKWLSDQGAEVTLINAGVSGDTSAGGAARVDWTLTPDVDGMIVTLGGNDLLRGIDPAVTRSNLETILQAAEEAGVEVLLIGMEAPGNFGVAYKEQFESNYAELADAYGTLFIPSFLGGLAGDGADPASLGAYMQADGIHPNAQGVSRIVAAIGPEVLMLIEQSSTD